ncbi:hypothetical protein LguiA_033053 [Lonicera macranthoides]
MYPHNSITLIIYTKGWDRHIFRQIKSSPNPTFAIPNFYLKIHVAKSTHSVKKLNLTPEPAKGYHLQSAKKRR